MNTVSLIIQSLCMASIIAPSYKRKFESFLWCSLLLVIVNLMDSSFVWMLYIILVVIDSLYERKMRHLLASQIFLGLLIQSFCHLVSLLAVSTFEQLPIMVLSYNIMSNFEVTIVYLGLFTLVSTLIYHYNVTVKERSYSNMLGVLFAIMFYIVNGFLDALLYGNITLNDVQRFSLSFIAFGLVLIYIIFLFNKENEAELVAQKIQTQEAMVRNNLLLIDGIQSNIQDLEHRMNYVLLSLKHMILDNKKTEALKIIQENTWNLKKVSYYVNTGNPYFDNLFSRILKKYIDHGIVPACFLEIPKNSIDYHLEFVSMVVDFFTRLLNNLDNQQQMNISIQMKQSYYIIKVLLQNISVEELNMTLPKDSSIQMIDDEMIEIKIVYKANQEL